MVVPEPTIGPLQSFSCQFQLVASDKIPSIERSVDVPLQIEIELVIEVIIGSIQGGGISWAFVAILNKPAKKTKTSSFDRK